MLERLCGKCETVTVRYKSGDCKPCAARRYRTNKPRLRAAAAKRDKENRAHNQATQRAWRAKVPEQLQLRRRIQLYKMSVAEFETRLAAQKGRCAACETSFEDQTPHVDHDHACCPGKRSCGKCVRGLLCRRCNWILGQARDDAKLLGRVANYIAGKTDTCLISA
ncbi:MAG: endonuclease VII domain-containing protein [Nocardiaceae bacterium]|nr:endonuclease VII domain-containing protein [Nocardiaceae bacterium]